jgi:hypothetical protein
LIEPLRGPKVEKVAVEEVVVEVAVEGQEVH